MKNIFITGIGTNVGKTVASAVITEALQADYWKPIQTGSNDLTDTQNIKNLISNTKSVIHNESYLFKEPVSPHLAASLENQTIQLSNIVIPNTENNIVIEGAGGILVPINNTHFVIDLANVNSCSFIATKDLGRLHPNNQLELMGRYDNSDVRGCNLMMEQFT